VGKIDGDGNEPDARTAWKNGAVHRKGSRDSPKEGEEYVQKKNAALQRRRRCKIVKRQQGNKAHKSRYTEGNTGVGTYELNGDPPPPQKKTPTQERTKNEYCTRNSFPLRGHARSRKDALVRAGADIRFQGNLQERVSLPEKMKKRWWQTTPYTIVSRGNSQEWGGLREGTICSLEEERSSYKAERSSRHALKGERSPISKKKLQVLRRESIREPRDENRQGREGKDQVAL